MLPFKRGTLMMRKYLNLRQGGSLMIVKVDFDYDADYMYCPDCVDMDMDTLIKEFNEWIYDSNVAHPFWTDESRLAVCYRADAIAYWLNEYILPKDNKPTKVLEQMVKEDKAYDYAVIL